jgi:hypothetical protein
VLSNRSSTICCFAACLSIKSKALLKGTLLQPLKSRVGPTVAVEEQCLPGLIDEAHQPHSEGAYDHTTIQEQARFIRSARYPAR